MAHIVFNGLVFVLFARNISALGTLAVQVHRSRCNSKLRDAFSFFRTFRHGDAAVADAWGWGVKIKEKIRQQTAASTCRCQATPHAIDGGSHHDATLLLPPYCQIFLPSFALNNGNTTTTSKDEAFDWEWVLWENQARASSASLKDNVVASCPSTFAALELNKQQQQHPILVGAAQAAWETWRWCANVVVPLQLCPWAASSVQTPDAIRMYLMVVSPPPPTTTTTTNPIGSSNTHGKSLRHQSSRPIEERMQLAVALAVNHWWQDVQQPHENSDIQHATLDPKTAIAFCVYVTPGSTQTTRSTAEETVTVTTIETTDTLQIQEYNNNNNHQKKKIDDYDDEDDTRLWDFDSFYDWFVDLEEYQDWWKPSFSSSTDDADVYGDLAEHIILAPFHPDWQYYSDSSSDTDDDDNNDDGEEEEEEKEERQCWAYEKKSPHPTVSMVATSVVEQAGPTVTERIATNNAELLSKLGTERLNQLYRDKVWLYE